MTIERVGDVLRHSKAKGTEKVVLIGIANHDGDGGAWPSIETLSKYANVDRRSIQRAISNLVAMGELEVIPQGGGNRETRDDRRPNLYRIHLTPREDGVTPVSPRSIDGVTSVTERGDAGVANGVTSVTPRGDAHAALTVHEPSTEPPSKDSAPVRDLFDTFWETYPRKAGKVDARKAWAKAIRTADPRDIILGAMRYATDPNRSPAYTAHPATWLNAGRWEDDPLPAPDEKVSGARAYAEIAAGALALDWGSP